MKKTATSAAALIAGSLLLSGCNTHPAPRDTYSLDTSGLSSYESLEEFVVVFTEAGGGCGSFGEIPTIPGNTSAVCEDSSQLILMSPENVEELRSSANEGVSLQGTEVISGNNWGIINVRPADNNAIATVLGGEVIRERR